MKKSEVLKEIDNKIATYKHRIELRQGANYHDEVERIKSFEEKISVLGEVKEWVNKIDEPVVRNKCPYKREWCTGEDISCYRCLEGEKHEFTNTKQED